MTPASMPARRDSEVLSLAVKLIRRDRKLTAAEVAERMRTPLRTYERFEAGGSRLNVDYIHRFAAATDSDPHAILAAVTIGSPEFALRGADNKLATILAVGLQRFNYILGDRIQTLDARAIINAVCAMYEELLREGGEQQRAAAWLDLGLTDLAMLRPKPGRS